MAGELFHVIDTHGFNRPLLDQLCALTTCVRGIAKSPEGARALQQVAAHRAGHAVFPAAVHPHVSLL